MTILIIVACLIAFVLLISWGKIHPFLAFLIVSIVTGLVLGLPLSAVTHAVEVGIGDTLGKLVIVIALGAMLGKLVAESGAAQKISTTLMGVFGKKNIQWALMITGFVVGIPLFYNVGFVLLIPLIFSVVYQYKLPAVYTGLPMLAALSVTHGFLQPHPSPTALVAQFDADMGKTLLYGIIVAIPAILIAGPLFAKSLKNIKSVPLETFQPKLLPDDQLPGTFNSFLCSLLPVILLVSLIPLGWKTDESTAWLIMLVSLIIATFLIGLRNGRGMKKVMDFYADAVKDVSIILLIVAGAGALKQIFIDSGASKEIASAFLNLHIHPLLLGWTIAAIIRVCLGSATVAGLTTAGILAPMMEEMQNNPDIQVRPELMVLSIGAGSLMFSHVNDAGFWMFKEYFNLSIKDTLRSWSLMETTIAIVGLAGVTALHLFIH